MLLVVILTLEVQELDMSRRTTQSSSSYILAMCMLNIAYMIKFCLPDIVY